MSKKKIFIAGLLVVALAAFVPAALANHGYGGGYGKGFCPHAKSGCGQDQGGLKGKFFHKAHKLLKLSDEIGLSEDQVKSIRTLEIDTTKKLIQQKAQMKVLKLDIMQKLWDKPIDTAAIDQLIDQKYEIKKSMAKDVVAAFAKLKGTLTDEQWAKFKELKKQHHIKQGKH